MNACPVCRAAVKPSDRECACGELLAPWRNLAYYAETMRQRGLTLARAEDHLGACLAFLFAAMSNPLDRSGFADAIRALVRLGRFGEAREIAAALAGEDPNGGFAEFARWLGEREVALTATRAAEAAPPVEAGAPAEAGPPCRPRLLGLPPLERRAAWPTRWFSRGRGDELWTTIIGLENLDGGAAVAWGRLREAVPDAAAKDYAAGLDALLRGEAAAARAAFAACLVRQPPVLNPAAYYLYLHLDDPRQLGAARERLRQHGQPAELEFVIARLEEALRQRGDAARCRALLRLRHGDAPADADPEGQVADDSDVAAASRAAVDRSSDAAPPASEAEAQKPA